MKLLDVEVVLDRDKGIQQAGHKSEVMKERDDTTTRYAILSHRWGAEVNYEEMIGLMKMEEEEREEVKQRHGYQKIIESCEQAMKDGYEWLWVDTCCIDKRSSAELSEAINSMYRWYQNAQVCYAYLNDVGESTFPTKKDDNKFAESNGWSEWFMRGWTLQELIAPKEVKFFNKDWVHIGNKRQLEPILEKATGIPRAVLRNGIAGRRLSVAAIMSWAAERRTTRVEDRAYSLMGLFGVYMPMLYGEGKMAFQRLQLEIIRRSSDQSIFAWKPQIPRIGSVLADDPCDFRNCGGIEKVEPDRLGDRLMEYIGWLELGHPWYIRRTSFSKIATNPVHWCRLAWLRWRARTLNQQLYSFTVSNAGIQVCLPVVPIPDSPSHYRALLACSYGWSLISIDLVSTGSSFDRIPYIHTTPKTYPEFKTFYLASHQDVNEKCRTFILDDKHASYYGFKRCATYPREFMGDAVTLSSLTSDLVVVVYANSDTGFCFVVGLGYHYGQDWVHVDYDEHSSTEEENWTNFGSRAYNRMWEVRSTHARDVAEGGPVRYDQYCMKHAHFPRSTKGARVVWGRWEDNFKVMVDVVDCPGCCDGPRKTTITSNDRYGLTMPGLMRTVSYSYSLRLDEELAPVDDCSGLRLALGDYGDYSRGDFVRTGNIFDDMRVAGIGHEDSTHSPIVFRELSARLQADRNQGDLAVARSYSSSKKYLTLHQPRVLSLPANEHFSLLLKALSTRLAGKHLVIAIVQCQDFYSVDEGGKRRDSGDDSAPANGNRSTETGRLTPLCTIASPQVWRRGLPCLQRMARFRSIREHFDALVDLHQPTGTTQFDKSANKQKKDVAIKFFSDLFGLMYLRNYIGDITFFARFPSVMETSTVSDVPSAGAAEDSEDGLVARPYKLPCASSLMRYISFRGIWQFADAEPDSRLERVLPLLRRRCQTVFAQSDVPRWYARESRRVNGEIKSVSQTLGADLYAHIRVAFYNAYHEQKPSTEAKHRVSTLKYDRHLDTLSVVHDIKALRAKLDATIDEGESRALEEDITGKILWLFWCGMCCEADELLPKVVDYIRREGSARGLDRLSRLTPAAELSDDQAHLQRIMYDAGANTSKYQLWLDARAREQAKWPSTDRGTPTIHDQATPQTSTQKGKLSESHGVDARADDELTNRSKRRLRRHGWYGGDGWVSRLIVISYPAALVFVIRALSVQ